VFFMRWEQKLILFQETSGFNRLKSLNETHCCLFHYASCNEDKNALFTSRMYLNLRKKLVKYYIWSIALYCAETIFGA
jgi:hypothetical protein